MKIYNITYFCFAISNRETKMTLARFELALRDSKSRVLTELDDRVWCLLSESDRRPSLCRNLNTREMHYHYAKEAIMSRLPGFFKEKNQTPTPLQGIEPRFPYRNMASAFPLGDRSKVSERPESNQRLFEHHLAKILLQSNFLPIEIRSECQMMFPSSTSLS